MATLLKVLNNLADIKSAGGVALRVRTQARRCSAGVHTKWFLIGERGQWEPRNREVGNERRRFAPQDAFDAWPWGGIGLHAIGSAGAVRGRSTGSHSGHSGHPCC